MSNFLREWKYMCSKDNTQARGLFLAVSVIMPLLCIVATVALVLTIIKQPAGIAMALGYALAPVLYALTALLVFMLKKLMH